MTNLFSRRSDSSFSPFSRLPLSWGAILAGTLASLLTYATLLALGLAVGGDGFSSLVKGGPDASVGAGPAVWLVASVAVALATGGFLTGWCAGAALGRVARVQAVMMAGLFFGLLFSGAGWWGNGNLGGGLGHLASSLSRGGNSFEANPASQELFKNAIEGLTLRSDPEVVAKGIVNRLLRGKDSLALNYLASEAGISRSEAQRRIETVKAQFDQMVIDARNDAADATQVAGWTILLSLSLGTALAMGCSELGGHQRLTSAEELVQHPSLLKKAA